MKNLFGHKHAPAVATETAPQMTNVTTTTTTTAAPLQAPLQAPSFMPMEVAATKTTEAPMQERIEKPAVMHERIRKEEVEEVQPVIHREHERTEVHQILQPMYEGQVAPAHFLDKQLPAEVLPTVTRGVYVPSPLEQNTTEYVGTERVMVEKSPIIMETDKKKIIEEFQPVIYKETIEPTIIRETKPIYEKIVEAPVVVKEVREPIHLHTTGQQKEGTFLEKGGEQHQCHLARGGEGFATGRAPLVLEKTVTVQKTHSQISPQ